MAVLLLCGETMSKIIIASIFFLTAIERYTETRFEAKIVTLGVAEKYMIVVLNRAGRRSRVQIHRSPSVWSLYFLLMLVWLSTTVQRNAWIVFLCYSIICSKSDVGVNMKQTL